VRVVGRVAQRFVGSMTRPTRLRSDTRLAAVRRVDDPTYAAMRLRARRGMPALLLGAWHPAANTPFLKPLQHCSRAVAHVVSGTRPCWSACLPATSSRESMAPGGLFTSPYAHRKRVRTLRNRRGRRDLQAFRRRGAASRLIPLPAPATGVRDFSS